MKVSVILCSNMHMDIENGNILLSNISSNPKFEIISDYTKADIVIIMTCAFGTKKEYGMYVIADVKNKCMANSKVIVSGCLLKTNYDELKAIPGITLKTFEELKEYFKNDSVIVKDYFKQNKVIISSGCKKHCSYCIYPLMQEKYVSKPIEEVLKEVEKLYDNELIIYLTGALETSDYGIDLYGTCKFAELLIAICTKFPNCNYSIGWFHPAGLTSEVIEVIEKYKNIVEIMVHVQHADNEILKNMNRPSFEFTCNKLKELKSKRPDLIISTEVIVGFPGETEEKFQKLVDFLDLGLFDDIGVASYEPVFGAKSVYFPNHISYETRNSRMEYIKKRYDCCLTYPAPEVDFKPILEMYLEARRNLDNLPEYFLLPDKIQYSKYFAGVDTDLKMPKNFEKLMLEIFEEIKEARDEFSIKQVKAKIQETYTLEFRYFIYVVFENMVSGKDAMLKRFQEVILEN